MSEPRSPGDLFDELVEMAAHLRGPEGCPWDQRQTIESIRPHFLEEAHEAAEALIRGDFDGFREEVGDTLFLTVFLVHLAEERGEFDIADSIRTILEKMRRRHPHVYGGAGERNESEVLLSWEEAKRAEKGKRERESILDGVPASMPALLRARRVQQKAANIGFDWKETAPIVEKIDEEVREVKEALAEEDADRVEEEIGDLLFTVVNLARRMEIDPEAALIRTIDKFRERFQKIEKRIDPDDPPPLEVLDKYWEESK
ncbi:MAG: nucleoside triphosphate pyrophosphohydrolase [Candidatus Eisenbacteria bacterium]|nr:nucleoside triphosphate pyrophosphohydrolase [Candidatus Eisenbacteria bacterium]